MSDAPATGWRVAVIGPDTLRGREIQSVLSERRFPIKTIEFYDPEVKEEYSKLGEFKGSPKVVHHLEPGLLEGLDVVFLAADAKTSLDCGRQAGKLGFRAVDLCEAFNEDPDVPLVVAGVNDDVLKGGRVGLVANPSPVTIILAHLLASVRRAFGVERALSVVMEPVSAFGEAGIQELADQSMAMLGGSSMPRKIFSGQVAFNVLSHHGKLDRRGFTGREKRIRAEIGRVLGGEAFPFSLTMVLAPVFHAYSIMTYVETAREADAAGLRECLGGDPSIDTVVGGSGEPVTSISVAGKDRIFVGLIKKDDSIPRGFWIWASADNLTVGSAVNAHGIALDICRGA